jgi:hypothetical protein
MWKRLNFYSKLCNWICIKRKKKKHVTFACIYFLSQKNKDTHVNESRQQTSSYSCQNLGLWKSKRKKQECMLGLKWGLLDACVTQCVCMHVDVFTFEMRKMNEWLKLNSSGWEMGRGRTECVKRRTTWIGMEPRNNNIIFI